MKLLSLWFILLLPMAASTNDTSTELPFPREASSDGLSLDQINKIMFTEMQEEFGVRRLSHQESNDLWKAATTYEWTLAEEREEYSHLDSRRAKKGKPKGLSPFIVCDMRFGEAGEKCKQNIVDALGSDDLIPLYNKDDMTCFAVEALTSTAKNLPNSVAVTPISPEMKMAPNLANHIANSNPMIARIEAMFCAGETESIEDARDLADDLLVAMSSKGDRKLRIESFLESRATRDKDREAFWNRQLQNLSDEVCQDMLDSFELGVSNNTMMLTLPPEDRLDSYRECLHALIVNLATQPEVCFIGGYQQIEPYNTLASGIVQSGSSDSMPFYDVGLDGDGQVVAMSDTGVDTDNCYFYDNKRSVSKNKSGTFDLDVRKVVQYVSFSDDSDYEAGHGTHVAGTIVGKASDGSKEKDGAGDGVAKAAKLAVSDIGNSAGRLSLPSIDTLFTAGYKAAARIHSASWGTPNQNAYATTDVSVDDFVSKNPDFLFVVAAGNSGSGNAENSVSSPAVCKNGLAVGASQNARPHISRDQEGPDYLADFSSRGPTADGRRKPECVAPGMFIRSARADPDNIGECDASNGLTFKAGTSMSTPVVSGIAALIRQYFTEGWHVSGSPDASVGFGPRASLVKAVILNGGQALLGIQSGTTGAITKTVPYDEHQGFGRVNLLDSVPLEGKNDIKGIFVNAKSISNGDKNEYVLRIDEGDGCKSPLSATLVWTDPAAGAFCNAGCVLNDLDLYVTQGDKSGRIFPNGLGKPDRSNNVERVRIDEPVNGATYTVHVEGKQLIEAQEYSLVITGCLVDDVGDDPGDDGSTDMPTPAPAGESNQGDDTATTCEDGTGNVLVNAGRNEDCSWLSSSLSQNQYKYLCDFLDVALECPSTCNICLLLDSGEIVDGPEQASGTDFDGSVRWYGTMFDIKAKKDLTINGFDVHINFSNSYQIQVYARGGSLTAPTNEWTLICDATDVVGGRYGSATPLPDGACTPITVAKDDYQAFYVTLVEDPDMVLQKVESGSVYDGPDMAINSGVAVTYPDAGSYEGYSFDGKIHYTVATKSLSPCEDKPDTVMMDDLVGARSCSWLARNMDRFSYVCSFTEPSLHCPVTCDVCDQLEA